MNFRIEPVIKFWAEKSHFIVPTKCFEQHKDSFLFFFFLVTDSQILKHRHKTSLNCSLFDLYGVIYWHA